VNKRVLLIVVVRSVLNGDDLSGSVVEKYVSECDVEESIDVLELIEVSVVSKELKILFELVVLVLIDEVVLVDVVVGVVVNVAVVAFVVEALVAVLLVIMVVREVVFVVIVGVVVVVEDVFIKLLARAAIMIKNIAINTITMKMLRHALKLHLFLKNDQYLSNSSLLKSNFK
jgi:hypothetical protein